MTRKFSACVGLAVFSAAVLVGCGGDTAEPVDMSADAGLETVALTVEGMT